MFIFINFIQFRFHVWFSKNGSEQTHAIWVTAGSPSILMNLCSTPHSFLSVRHTHTIDSTGNRLRDSDNSTSLSSSPFAKRNWILDKSIQCNIYSFRTFSLWKYQRKTVVLPFHTSSTPCSLRCHSNYNQLQILTMSFD